MGIDSPPIDVWDVTQESLQVDEKEGESNGRPKKPGRILNTSDNKVKDWFLKSSRFHVSGKMEPAKGFEPPT